MFEKLHIYTTTKVIVALFLQQFQSWYALMTAMISWSQQKRRRRNWERETRLFLKRQESWWLPSYPDNDQALCLSVMHSSQVIPYEFILFHPSYKTHIHSPISSNRILKWMELNHKSWTFLSHNRLVQNHSSRLLHRVAWKLWVKRPNGLKWTNWILSKWICFNSSCW